MFTCFTSPSLAHSPLEFLRPANPTPYHPQNLPSSLSPFLRPSNPTPYHPQNLLKNLEETRSVCRVLNEAGFVNMEKFIDSHGVRDNEADRILRAWEFNEGIREDCLVNDAKEKILMLRENWADGEKGKENEVFTASAGIKKSANAEKSKIMGKTRNFITNQAPIPQQTYEEMNYSSDDSYFSTF